MPTSVADIRAAYREFSAATHPTDAEIQARIDAAERDLDQAVLGDQYDDAIQLWVAQSLARSSYARDLRLKKDEHATIFDEPLRAILEPLGRSWRTLP